MASVQMDIVCRSTATDVRASKKNIKNPWRWEWLEKQVERVYLRETIRKLSKPGIGYCIVCCQQLNYGSRGFDALVKHMKSVKHKSGVQARKENFALPGIGGLTNEKPGTSYGLHPMYAPAASTVELNLPQPLTPLTDRLANSEAMLLSFIAEKSLPFAIVPDLLDLVKELSKDKKALNHLHMHRTSASYKLRFGVAKTFKENLIKDLSTTFFSLNLDESTINNNKKIVTVLVNYVSKEKRIVTKHLASYSVDKVNSDSIFQGLLKIFEDNDLPWQNLMSVLLDSCNVMRGKKSGLETKIRAKCPHLLDIDGDSCHHAHNAAKQFCKPFGMYLEALFTDIHNDLKWSPDLRAVLIEMCEVLHVKYTMPQNFVSFRWLSVYDATQDLVRLFNALTLFYYSFMCPINKTNFLHIVVKVYKTYNVSSEGRNIIRSLQATLAKKNLTEAGRERKYRISKKLLENQLQTKLIMGLFSSVLPLLKEYVKLFQFGTPLIHLLHDKQADLIRTFLACFVKPEVLQLIGGSTTKLKMLETGKTNNHLPMKSIFVGEMVKQLIAVSPKSQCDTVKQFQCNVIKAYVACSSTLQTKMPITNPFLKAVSAIDPLCRQHSLSLKHMQELSKYVQNVIADEEKELYDLEVRKFHAASIHPPKNSEPIDAWWVAIESSTIYPLLSRMALALLTCFHGPKVESSFSIMNNVITPGNSQINVGTFDAIQSVKYEFLAQKTSSVALFRKKDFLKEPVERVLCQNIRTACKSYENEKCQNRAIQEKRKVQIHQTKIISVSKEAAKKLSVNAAKTQRNKHLEKLHPTSELFNVITEKPRLSIDCAKSSLQQSTLESTGLKPQNLELTVPSAEVKRKLEPSNLGITSKKLKLSSTEKLNPVKKIKNSYNIKEMFERVAMKKNS